MTASKNANSEVAVKPAPKSLAFKVSFACLSACNFLSALDAVIVAAALPVISRALHSTSNQAYWCGTGFLFAQAVSQPIYGAFAEVFGKKRCLLFSLGLFTVASLLCALAQTISWLVTARVFQGIGAGGNNALIMMIVADMVPLRERAKFIAIIATTGAIANVSGLVIGGALAQDSTWRWIFYINLPIGVPALVGIAYFMRFSAPKENMRKRLQMFDWFGIIILTGSLVGILFGVSGGGVLYNWNSVNILCAIVLGVVGIVAFVCYEARLAPHPMIPMRIFLNRTAASSLISSMVNGIVLWAMIYYLILYFLISKQHSLQGAAIAVIPATAMVAPSTVVGGIIVSKTKRFRTMNVIAWGFLVLGSGLLTTLSTSSNKGEQFGFQILFGIGGGVIFMGRLCAMQASQKDKDVPMGTALISFFSSLGQAFGVAIGGGVFENAWNSNVATAVRQGRLPAQYVFSASDAEQAATIIQRYPADVQDIYRHIAARAVDLIFIVLAGFSGFAMLGSLFSENLSMDKESRSEQQFINKASREEKQTNQELGKKEGVTMNETPQETQEEETH